MRTFVGQMVYNAYLAGELEYFLLSFVRFIRGFLIGLFWVVYYPLEGVVFFLFFFLLPFSFGVDFLELITTIEG